MRLDFRKKKTSPTGNFCCMRNASNNAHSLCKPSVAFNKSLSHRTLRNLRHILECYKATRTCQIRAGSQSNARFHIRMYTDARFRTILHRNAYASRPRIVNAFVRPQLVFIHLHRTRIHKLDGGQREQTESPTRVRGHERPPRNSHWYPTHCASNQQNLCQKQPSFETA